MSPNSLVQSILTLKFTWFRHLSDLPSTLAHVSSDISLGDELATRTPGMSVVHRKSELGIPHQQGAKKILCNLSYTKKQKHVSDGLFVSIQVVDPVPGMS